MDDVVVYTFLQAYRLTPVRAVRDMLFVNEAGEVRYIKAGSVVPVPEPVGPLLQTKKPPPASS